MKKLIGIIGFCLLAWAMAYMQQHDVPRKAWAGIVCTLPVTLANGTTADATQVMSNFNQLVACFTTVGGVNSVVCGTGLDGGTITLNGTCSLAAARRTLPTTQLFNTAGTFTYTTPTNVLWIEIWLQGAGGGGAGGGNAGNGTNGTNGTDTCWGANGCTSPLFDAGGGVGSVQISSSSNGGAGGVVSGSLGCGIGVNGGDGQATGGNQQGYAGGVSARGGNGAKGGISANGANAAPNSGSGGQGGGGNQGAAGGGAGAYCYAVINAPVASYIIQVGAKGTGGTASSNGNLGGNGGDGSIYVLEHYGT